MTLNCSLTNQVHYFFLPSNQTTCEEIKKREDAPEFPKKEVRRGSTRRVQGRLEVEAVGRRGGNNPAIGEALRAISMAEEKRREGFSCLI